MADINVEQLAQELGVPIDAEKPIESIKSVWSAMKEKSDKAGAVDERLAKMEGMMQGLAGHTDGAGDPNGTTPGGHAKDTDVMRRAQDELIRAKTLPGLDELDRFLYGGPPVDEQVKALQDFNDLCLVMDYGRRQRNASLQSMDFYKRTMSAAPALQKALTSDGSTGAGVDWVPTAFSGQVWEDLRLQTLVADNLVQIDMPTEAFKLPYKSGSATPYLTQQATNMTLSQFTTGNDTLDAVGFGCALQFSGEMAEDSVSAVLPLVRADLATTLAEALENCLVNGDTTGSHMDSDTTGATDVRKGFKGFRKLALAGAIKVDGGTFSVAVLRSARKAMKKYGVNPANLMWVVGTSGLMTMMGLTEILTMEKYGANATLVTGELARIDGIPVVPSGMIREDLNASGVFDNSTKTKTCMHLVHKRQVLLGTRRRVTIEDDRFILGDYVIVVGKARWAFAPRIAVSADFPTQCIVYNVTS